MSYPQDLRFQHIVRDTGLRWHPKTCRLARSLETAPKGLLAGGLVLLTAIAGRLLSR